MIRIYVYAFVIISLLAGCKNDTSAIKNDKKVKSNITSSNIIETPKSDSSEVDTAKIIGLWKRTDGNYVLDIQKFNESNIEAAYYNPSPINIAETEWKTQDGYLYFFIKFDDENYRGSYYSLGYFPDKDLLMGFYYQAASRQKYEIIFERD